MAKPKKRDDAISGTIQRFFKYSALTSTVLPKEGADSSPIPFRYAAMAAFNEVLLHAYEDNPTANLVELKIEQADLIQKIMPRGRWVGTEHQLKITVGKLKATGYLSGEKETIYIEQKMRDVFVEHAKALSTFMTRKNIDDLSNAPFANWLELNEEIFSCFYFGEFGNAWRNLRQRITEKLRERPGYNRNAINEKPAMWVAVNLLALLGPVYRFDLSTLVGKLEIEQFMEKIGEIEVAAEELVEAGVAAYDKNEKTFALTPIFAKKAVAFKSAISTGLSRLQKVCEIGIKKIATEKGKKTSSSMKGTRLKKVA